MNNQNMIELNDANWEKNVEKGSKPVMVMFFGTSCPHCQIMKPHFKKYADEFKDKVVFGQVNVAESPTIVSRYGIMGTPTFKFFCNGKPIQELVGAIYPTLIKKTVEDSLKMGSQCVSNTTWIDSGISGYA
jgi:thioredoxin-like negative regulator of GroEL